MIKRNAIQLFVIIICLLLIISIGYFIVKNLIYINDLNADILRIEKEIEQSSLLLNKMQEADKKADQMEAQINELSKMIPKDPKQEQILMDIHDTASSLSIPLENIQFGTLVKKDSFTEMPLDLSFKGNYNGLLKLLADLMYGERLIRIDEVRIDNQVDGLMIDLKAKYFYAP